MKKLLFFTLGLMALSQLYAQNWDTPSYEKGKQYEGYVVLNNGDTIPGKLTAQYPADLNSKNHVSVMLSNQTSCLFYNPADNKTVRYKPKDLKAYFLAGRLYVSMDYSGGLVGKGKSFVLLTAAGKLAKYTFYLCKPDLMTNQGSNESTTDYYNRIYSTKTIYYREGSVPVDQESMALGFKNKMAGLVEDNVPLATKIQNKEKGYRLMNMDKIIAEYNNGN
ncbi:MAG: hypothetical protein KDD41_01740 [Flavobacteriales bacterium]|nr:hypothetical protein [Flavobacteriales bacterium]